MHRRHVIRKRANEDGFSLLEQALVLPVFLLLILAAVDISRMLQAYSVLDDGLRLALRCVYPANGDCITTTPDSTQATYDVFERNAEFRYTQYDYSADAGWLRLPVYESSSINARVLDRLYYDVPSLAATFERPLYDLNTAAHFGVQEHAFPFIDADITGVLTPSLTIPGVVNARGQRIPYPATWSEDISDIQFRMNSSSGPDHTSGHRRLRFTLTSPRAGWGLRAGELCLEQDRSNPDPRSWPECGLQKLFSGSKYDGRIKLAKREIFGSGADANERDGDYTFIVVDLRGDARAETNADPAIHISLRQAGFTTDLRGRVFDSNVSGSIIPRGAPVSSYSRVIRDNYNAEVVSHEAILVKYGEPVEVLLDLVVPSGVTSEVTWSGRSLRIYTPIYGPASSAPAVCVNAGGSPRRVSPCEFSSITGCLTDVHSIPARENGIAPSAMPSAAEKKTVCDEQGGVSARDLLYAGSVTCPGDFVAVADGTGVQCSVRAGDPVVCPSNYGVNTGAGADGMLRDSPEAGRICPVPSSDSPYAANLRWSERDITPPGVSPIRWVKSNCTQNAPVGSELPAELSRYPKLAIAYGSEPIEYQNLYTGGQSIEQFRSTQPIYRCPEIEEATRHWDATSTDLKNESLFRAHHYLGESYEDRLRDDAMSMHHNPSDNLDPGAYFEARVERSERRVSTPPDDPAILYWFDPDTLGAWNRVQHGVPLHEVPPQCRGSSAVCRSVPISLEGTPATVEPRLAISESRAYEAAEGMMPNIRRGCAQNGSPRNQPCVQFAVTDTHDGQGRTKFNAQGEIQVPLILSPVPFRVTRGVGENWETDLAGGG